MEKGLFIREGEASLCNVCKRRELRIVEKSSLVDNEVWLQCKCCEHAEIGCRDGDGYRYPVCEDWYQWHSEIEEYREWWEQEILREQVSKQKSRGFLTWLRQQENRGDPVGDLAGDAKYDPELRHLKTYGEWMLHLADVGACDGAIDAFKEAWAEWQSSQPQEESVTSLICNRCERKARGSDLYMWDGEGWVCGRCRNNLDKGYFAEQMKLFRDTSRELLLPIERICKDCHKSYSIEFWHYDAIGGTPEEKFCDSCAERRCQERKVSESPKRKSSSEALVHSVQQQVKAVQSRVHKVENAIAGRLRLRYFVFKRDNYHCKVCGRGVEDGVKLELAHNHARSKGGEDTEANTFCACFDCNRGMYTDSL